MKKIRDFLFIENSGFFFFQMLTNLIPGELLRDGFSKERYLRRKKFLLFSSKQKILILFFFFEIFLFWNFLS